MPSEQQHLHAAAVSHIRQCFSRIKQQVEQVGKEVAAYYFYLVDDFFAAGNAAITHQDLAAFAAKHRKEYKNCTILQAIWDGRCTLYDGETKIQNVSKNWLENQSELYQAGYRSIENLDDDDGTYQQKRAEYETALIAALQQCDQEGLFGNRAENGILLFAFYIDDYDENDEQSLLYRSATQLNQPDTYQKLIG
ncbi:hypothetical protein A7Q01_02430 [Eikenella sp. NML96-A-049]|uniref:DUF4303 domain-containing protein n=1 Tax=unclassified Eikenella TaxID=2639367 RepID=UPI0007E11010|nr:MULTISPECIES: DUF4303 domain-containing protein [unclassified Eikenella]OAM33807.1 hypothetical protein A7P97_07760 [Eikenella sp. NML070372]OAM41808.1 hypothetical protein A7Q01_02430 [Eikenella sp. NML96-A-049]VDG99763.1 Uncharacterised protein [Helicobacter pametensis]